MGSCWVYYIDGIGAGIYLLFGLSRLDLWRRQAHRPAHLQLAAIAFSALLVNGTGRLLQNHAGAQFPLGISLNLLGVGGVTVSILELVLGLARIRPPKAVRIVEIGILFLAAASGLGGEVVVVTEVFSSVMLLAALGTGVLASLRGDEESRLLLAGVIVLVVCLVLDLSGAMGLLPWAPGLPILGFLILFLIAAHAVNLRLLREESASRTDPLTGILNRRGFLELSQLALNLAERSRSPWSIMMVDVDHFKPINDSFGHPQGDLVLQEISSVLTGMVRKQDLVARWGGDEFILLLSNTGSEGGLELGRKILCAVRNLRLNIGDGALSLTISAGLTEGLEGEALAQSIQRVDKALYRAKAEGRDRVVLEETGR